MSGVTTICFDLDSTLCVRDQDDEEIHEAVFDRVGVEPIFTPADVANVDATDLPTAESDLEYWENVFRAVATDVGCEAGLAPDLAEAMVDVVDPTAVSFREGARAALDHARERYDVALVTNGAESTQRAKLETLGIRDAFDATVFCDPATGIEPKPDPTPFRRVLADLDSSPDEAMHVGNSHRADVAGAHNAGLRSAWVPLERTAVESGPEPTYTLASPDELSGVLE